MKPGAGNLVAHVARMLAIATAIVACMFLPFLPGKYDGLAVTLSVMAQTLGVVGLILVPVGAMWLIHESRRRARTTTASYRFGVAAMVALAFVGLAVSLGALVTEGFALGTGVLALVVLCMSKLWPALTRLKNAEIAQYNPAPIYLLLIPTLAALVQFSFLDRAADFSRERAIRQSAQLINDIEEYRRANGQYPASILALWQDYRPEVMGISQFHYQPNGDAYNIYFEQLSTTLGTREIVMYNKRDEHFAISHDSDILRRGPEQVRLIGGYYAVNNAATPHWKYFLFD